MGGSSSKAKAKEKEKESATEAEKEKEKARKPSQQHRVTPVAKKAPDAATPTTGSTPQPSPRQPPPASASARAAAPAAAPPPAAVSTVRPATLESPGHSNNSLLDEFSNEDSVELQLSDTSHLEMSADLAPGDGPFVDLEAIANEFMTEQQAS